MNQPKYIPPGNSPQVINSFSGEFAFLSNFFPCHIRMNGKLFYSAEQAYHYQKLTTQEDRRLMLDKIDPMQAKRFSRKCEQLPGWDSIRTGVMFEVVRSKFEQNGYLAYNLRQTAPAQLLEGNHWNDTYWGCVFNEYGWVGDNHLGRILMIVRDFLL